MKFYTKTRGNNICSYFLAPPQKERDVSMTCDWFWREKDWGRERGKNLMTEKAWVAHYLEGHGRQKICSLTHVQVDIWKPLHRSLVRSERVTSLLPRTLVNRNARHCWEALCGLTKAGGYTSVTSTPTRPKLVKSLFSCPQVVWMFLFYSSPQ